MLKSFLQPKSARSAYLRQKSVQKSFWRQKKYIKLEFDVQVICAVFVTSAPFYVDITVQTSLMHKFQSRFLKQYSFISWMCRSLQIKQGTGVEFLKESNIILLVSQQNDPSFNDETKFCLFPWPRLSRNFPGYPETFQRIRKLSRLSGNIQPIQK